MLLESFCKGLHLGLSSAQQGTALACVPPAPITSRRRAAGRATRAWRRRHSGRRWRRRACAASWRCAAGGRGAAACTALQALGLCRWSQCPRRRRCCCLLSAALKQGLAQTTPNLFPPPPQCGPRERCWAPSPSTHARPSACKRRTRGAASRTCLHCASLRSCRCAVLMRAQGMGLQAASNSCRRPATSHTLDGPASLLPLAAAPLAMHDLPARRCGQRLASASACGCRWKRPPSARATTGCVRRWKLMCAGTAGRAWRARTQPQWRVPPSLRPCPSSSSRSTRQQAHRCRHRRSGRCLRSSTATACRPRRHHPRCRHSSTSRGAPLEQFHF